VVLGINKKMDIIVQASELPNLCGKNQFRGPFETVKAIVARQASVSKPRKGQHQVFEEMRLSKDIVLRGKANYISEDLPVLLKTRKVKLTRKLWDADKLHCWALAALYKKETCRWIELCNDEQFSIDVPFDAVEWKKVVETVQSTIDQHIASIQPPSVEDMFEKKQLKKTKREHAKEEAVGDDFVFDA